MANGVIYCRVSSKEQVEGTSLGSQETACLDYARRNQLEIVRVFVEEGESAKFADRTQLLELLDFCRQRTNGISKLLVWKIDRFARNVTDHFSIKAELLKHGVDVVSVTEPIDAKPEGRLLETILAGFAQFDNDLRAARTVNGMRRKLQEGIFPWKAPFGYIKPVQPGLKKTEPDIPDVVVFPSLKKAWAMYATGAYMKSEILALLKTWGIRTRAGAPIVKQTLDNMLRDPFYAGVLRDPWSGEDHRGQHVPLVSPETFARIQSVIKRGHATRSVPHQRAHPDFPLRAFARCAQCQFNVTGARTRGRTRYYPYYRCSQHGCSLRRSFKTETVHAEFGEFLRSIVPSPAEVRRMTTHVERIVDGYVDDSRAATERWQNDLAALKRRQEKLIHMKMEDLIGREDFVRFNAQLSNRIAELSARTSGPGDVGGIFGHLENVCAQLRHLDRTWAVLPPEPRRRFQRMILPAGFVIGRIGTAEMSCLFATFEHFRTGKTQEVPPTGQFLNRLNHNLIELSEVFRAAANLQEIPKLAA